MEEPSAKHMSQHLICEIRKFMSKAGVSAYIILSGDPHQSEYVPTHLRRRAYVSGFTGSAGDLVITKDKAGLWTDSRYYLQARLQLRGTGIDLFKAGLKGVPSIGEWLAMKLKSDEAVGIDPNVFSNSAYSRLRKRLLPAGIQIKSILENPVDGLWTDRPPSPSGPAVPHPEEFSGESLFDRLCRVRAKTKAAGAEVLPVTALDALAWVFNIRGTDVEYNPVVIGYGAIEPERALLFIDKKKVTQSLEEHLGDLVKIRDYSSYEDYLHKLTQAGRTVLIDPDVVSRRIFDVLQGRCPLVCRKTPITDLKAQKNQTELAGIARAHVRDGAATVRFFAWLEEAIKTETITEIGAAKKLEEFRKMGERYVGPSFGTISAFGPNGAVVHYEPSPETDARLVPGGLYLVDSGAQYLDGTTDITRTTVLGGAPTEEMKDRFTRVLKGHIQLATASFPAGTTGSRLDTLARKYLWDVGLDYGHGTGHGVGAYLNVHEGPQAISYYRGMNAPLVEGMIISNEPGYYKENEWGIRTENLVQVVKNHTLSKGDTTFFKFETLTLCPIDRALINPAMLCDEELCFLNAYHKRVEETLSPLLDEASNKWLLRAVKEITR